MLDLSRLGPEQRRAVLAPDGPLVIVAGPGSGKTTVLAARIAYLILARGVPPTSLLALTFATKAARELRERLVGLLGEQGRRVDVATFHAFGLRIVREWSEELGLGPGPVAVYGADEARVLVRAAAQRCGVDLAERSAAEWAADLARHRLSGRSPDGEPLRTLARAYEELLHRRGAADYPAMLALPLRLFGERPAALRLVQDAYRHVLVDEFQDVCATQYALLRRIAERHRNLVVVGDPRQALYGWRGADVRLLLRVRTDFPEARTVSLGQNFRSTGRIVALANALGATLGDYGPLWTDNSPGRPAQLVVASDERAEATYVAAEVERLRAEGAIGGLGEVAVLYRTNRQARELAVAFRARRLPYRVRGGDLLACREVRDAVAYLRLAHNPADGAALARIVNVPPRRLGHLAEHLHVEPAAADRLPHLARGYGPAALVRAEALAALIADLHAQSGRLPPARLLDLALERSGYRAWLADQPESAARLDNLAELGALAERADGGLGDWLAELELGDEAADPGPDDGARVAFTTIHGAKGGEWRVAFVVGVEEGLLPYLGPAARGVGDRAGGRSADPDDVVAELRVAYVAVTRPRERLYLTCCRERRRGERVEPRRPSRFLRAVPDDLLARAA
ncbi:MAG: UvrD-helicase domain-containing protein [Chloroflexi bacterium]|nr:UvrD-helicase domain-containing protein [Chloroflexota bacterium]